MHLQAQQRLQEEGCLVDIREIITGGHLHLAIFMLLLKIIMREELMIHDALVMFQSLSFMRASLN